MSGSQPPADTAKDPNANQIATAEYIFELSGQLAGMADQSNLDFLAYLLEMARTEAAHVLKRLDPRLPDSRTADGT